MWNGGTTKDPFRRRSAGQRSNHDCMKGTSGGHFSCWEGKRIDEVRELRISDRINHSVAARASSVVPSVSESRQRRGRDTLTVPS